MNKKRIRQMDLALRRRLSDRPAADYFAPGNALLRAIESEGYMQRFTGLFSGTRLRCADVLSLCRPELETLCPGEPSEGWLAYAYDYARRLRILQIYELGVSMAEFEVERVGGELKRFGVEGSDVPFKVVSPYDPAGSQPKAIESLVQGVRDGDCYQVLLGVTGSGKTFTMAKTIEALGKPTLVMAPNKTLAAQLASELKEFFPNNAVVYFVSYYDYYQPEAYVPQSDTYIEKDSSINEEVEMLRHQATASLLSRRDVIVVASVSCIYGIGSPEDYAGLAPNVDKKVPLERDDFIHALIDIQYDRNDYDLARGTFRVRGDVVDVYPPYAEHPLRFEFFGDEVELIAEIDEVTGEMLREYEAIPVWPASHYVTEKPKVKAALKSISEECEKRVAELKATDKLLEAQRLQQRTDYDLEALQTMGFCSGIENFIATCGIDRGKILGLGVCMTGRVNPDTGRSYKYFTSSEQSLRDLLEERVGIRVLLENDTRARCYAEYTCGKSKDESNVLYLHMGRGVAIGIVVDGQLYYGKSGFAGEFGHVIVERNGRECGCGRRGCLETYVSATGIKRTAFELMAKMNAPSKLRSIAFDDFDASMISAAAEQGDPIALEAFRYTGEMLGRALADVVTVTSPQAIFLFGGLSKAGKLIFEPTQWYMEENMLFVFKNKVKLLPSGIQGKNAAILGASALIWQEAAK